MAVTAAILLSVASYLVIASTAVTVVRLTRGVALVSNLRLKRASIAPVTDLPEAWVARAVAAEPLDPGAINVAMAREVARAGEGSLQRWVPVLARLGWRDTPALQNRLFAAALRNDFPAILDISDAFMRRQKLTDQIIPILSMIEDNPPTFPFMVDRLVRNPDWRAIYLYSTGHLRTRDQLEARYALLGALGRRGIGIDPDALASNVNAMTSNGQPELGFDLWAAKHRGGVTRPLADADFVEAGGSRGDGNPVPFEWQLANGDGFSAVAEIQDGHGALVIDWNGRGVPVFARQRTSALPGRYQIDLDVAPANLHDLTALSASLMCGDAPLASTRDASLPQRFTTQDPVPCLFPVLQITGDIGANAVPRRIELRRVRLTRLGS